MENVRKIILRKLAQSLSKLSRAEDSGVDSEARSSAYACIDVLAHIGLPEDCSDIRDEFAAPVMTCEERFVMRALRAASPAAREKVFDILKNHAYE